MQDFFQRIFGESEYNEYIRAYLSWQSKESIEIFGIDVTVSDFDTIFQPDEDGGAEGEEEGEEEEEMNADGNNNNFETPNKRGPKARSLSEANNLIKNLRKEISKLRLQVKELEKKGGGGGGEGVEGIQKKSNAFLALVQKTASFKIKDPKDNKYHLTKDSAGVLSVLQNEGRVAAERYLLFLVALLVFGWV